MIDMCSNHPLAPLTTLKVEAKAARYVKFSSEEEVFDFLGKEEIDLRNCLVLGGGSNLLFVDDYKGIILHPQMKGIRVVGEEKGHLLVEVKAGENWDDLVALAVSNGWGGIENLSLIPGSVGASPIQNIGAYGVEAKDVIQSVTAISLPEKKNVTLPHGACGFGYRHSHFKGKWRGRYMITAVTYRLDKRPTFRIHYPGVEATVQRLGPLSLENLRKAIVALRRDKLPNPDEVGNAGSFFKNPLVDQARFKALRQTFPKMPAYHQKDGRVKLAAGWLIEQCGWKGKSLGRAAVHHRQALVLVNRGGATGGEIFELSEKILRSVWSKFAIELEREVQVVPA